MLYFAYGSNLDHENWAHWCAQKGFDAASIEPIGPAWLPDYEPVFHYQSRLRSGGALDVRRRRGTVTPGALFRVHDWAGLDAKEGVSGKYYRPIDVVALTDDGDVHRARTYTVCEARVGPFVPPGNEYRDMVTRGLARFGHATEQFLAVSEGERPRPALNRLFAYGTLMRGQPSHRLVADRLGARREPASLASATLVRIDWYPGLVLGSEGMVHGELFELDDVEATFQRLDPYEDFTGYGDERSLYLRAIVRVRTSKTDAPAWTYVFRGDTSGLPTIASGRWVEP